VARRRRNPSGRTLAISAGAIAALAVVGFLWWRKRQQEAHLFDPLFAPLPPDGRAVPTTTVTPAAASKILQAGAVKTAAPIRST
jgi:hypothetical protein